MAINSVHNNIAIARERGSHPRLLPDAQSATSRHAAAKVLVVIGESASREHLSVYGYPLPTTPRAVALKDSLYIMSGAVASSTSTAENMICFLTFKDDRPCPREWYDYPMTILLLRQLGYNTAWISNQEHSGEYSNLSGILAQDADYVSFLGAIDSKDHLSARYDDVMLPKVIELLNVDNSTDCIFMHLQGSHTDYSHRYPKDRSRFTVDDELSVWASMRPWLSRSKAATVAHYDNSIAYTDSILGVLLGVTASLQEPAVMVYFSDHGENVYDNRDFVGRDPQFVTVPFIVYPNQAYRRANPGIIDSLNDAQSRQFSSSALPHMLITLTGSDYQAYQPEEDPLNPHFKARTLYVDEQPYGAAAAN